MLSYTACKEKEQPKINDTKIINTAIKVKTITSMAGVNTTSINAIGIVLSESEARPSFKTGGVIAKTYVKEGDRVKRGQLLATLNMQEIDAQVMQAAEGLAKASRDLQRAKNLYADSVATLEQVQNATTAFEVAQNTEKIAKFNRHYSEVVSPIDGIVVKQIMHSGEVTGPGSPIYALMGTGSKDWRIRAGFIDKDWAQIKFGDKASYVFDAYPDQIYNVVVSDKSMIGGNASSTFDVVFKFLQKPPQLAAGLVGKVMLSNSTAASTVSLPIDCLTQASGYHAYVFLYKDGKAIKTSVKIGKLFGDKVEVLSGIKVTDEVITTGAMFLEDGDRVEVIK